jgi:hypothetical protein
MDLDILSFSFLIKIGEDTGEKADQGRKASPIDYQKVNWDHTHGVGNFVSLLWDCHYSPGRTHA